MLPSAAPALCQKLLLPAETAAELQLRLCLSPLRFTAQLISDDLHHAQSAQAKKMEGTRARGLVPFQTTPA